MYPFDLLYTLYWFLFGNFLIAYGIIINILLSILILSDKIIEPTQTEITSKSYSDGNYAVSIELNTMRRISQRWSQRWNQKPESKVDENFQNQDITLIRTG
jgi:hypothetical protein